MNIDQYFKQCNQLRVLVIGDVMLDAYYWGRVDRISPEAPVPIFLQEKIEYRMGGAGNVALNVSALGASVFLISMIGKDIEAKEILSIAKKEKVSVKYILTSAKRPTTSKVRIMSRHQQMIRLDKEDISFLSEKEEVVLIKQIKNCFEQVKPQVVILQDYNKGVLSKRIIEIVILEGKKISAMIAVDPKKNNFFHYKGVTLFKPNWKETKEAFNMGDMSISLQHLSAIHQALKKKIQHDISFITLSEKGVYYQYKQKKQIIPAYIRRVADVSGAGDTVIAVVSLMYVLTKDIALAATIGNIAGGLVCEELGTAVINKQKLLIECKQILMHKNS